MWNALAPSIAVGWTNPAAALVWCVNGSVGAAQSGDPVKLMLAVPPWSEDAFAVATVVVEMSPIAALVMLNATPVVVSVRWMPGTDERTVTGVVQVPPEMLTWLVMVWFVANSTVFPGVVTVRR